MNALITIIDTLLAVFGGVRPSSDTSFRDDDSPVVPGGQVNYRTGQLDAGLDPYGIYDDD